MSSLASRILVAPIRFYQRAISPLKPPTCRFYPTCSQYAVEAIRVHGAWRGLGYASWRLLKCGPWHPGGIDHVRPAASDRPAT
ncbi:membrane protein insertion efficiency factor YidD [Blastococcus sp. Marseille-P5729]|uniref:membrane protein insertion efficiency factor YidD n=1 Tax=Blastococcus sp. Marseille-P5729 TaxID=2086582 RepID=UPI000D102843|nr:membrane protein insertion efficiency factor YidD [Blastococcus sp. Marseille-P5729]